jgi:signal peptidase I
MIISPTLKDENNSKNIMETLKRIIASIFDFLQSIVVVMALMVMVYLFIISPQEISGQSMYPTFENGEYILTNKIEYKLHEPQRGDVIVFKSPRNKDIDYIKRIIAIPGDTLKLSNGRYYVNGEPVDESYLPANLYTSPGSYLQENVEIKIPPLSYFVSGDNRPHSLDAREFGPIPKQDIIGKAIIRYWPFERAGLIKNPF